MDEITEARFQLVDDRLEYFGTRLDTLEAAHAEQAADEKHAAGMRLNWIVVALFVAELVIGGWQLWWATHHG